MPSKYFILCEYGTFDYLPAHSQNDPGSMSATNDARHFTTYMKARIFCTRKVPMGRDNVGSIDYEYNNMSECVCVWGGEYIAVRMTTTELHVALTCAAPTEE